MIIQDIIKIMEQFPCLRPYTKIFMHGPHVQSLNIRNLHEWALMKDDSQTIQAARLVINIWNQREAISYGYHFNLVSALQLFDADHRAALIKFVTEYQNP